MRDGVKLGCTVFRPAGTRKRHPVIVSDFWPYYTKDSFQYMTANATFFAQHGYADLVCAMRGTYTSGGRFPGWFTSSDVRDNYDLIEWAAKQSWSNGKVGQEGASYGGISSLRAATTRPPHLIAIAPQFAFQDAYLGYFYPGGIRDDISQSPASGVRDFRGVTPKQQWATWVAHPLDDAYWRQESVQTSKINIPTLMIGGWQDYMVVGDIANYQALDPSKTWLVMGPWQHNLEPAPLTQSMLLAWFDHWLKQIPAAPLPSARVTSFEMAGSASGHWTEMPRYPSSAAALPASRAVQARRPTGSTRTTARLRSALRRLISRASLVVAIRRATPPATTSIA
jgi:predicted acyl esterase